MSRSLVKQFLTVEAKEKCVIDSNELIRRRQGDEAVEKTAREPDEDGFLPGLDAQEIEMSAEDAEAGNVLKAEEDMKALMEQVHAEAEEILADAHREADSILEAARIQAESEKKAVLERAKAQGYEEGHQKADAEAEAVRKQFDEKARQMEKEYQQQLDEIEPKFVDTITSIYEHIFQVELSSYREILEHLISNTIHRLEGGHSFLIHVSKDDYSYVNMRKKQILNGAVSAGDTVDVVEDMTLGKNECLIETEGGIFDCGLGTQMAELKRRLMLLAWSRED